MTKKECPFCCEQIESYMQKCPQCGELLGIICPYCGGAVSANAKICEHCSREITPTQIEEHAPWATASFVLMFFFCAVCIATCMSIFDSSPMGLANSTIDEKLENIGGILTIFALPLVTSIIACYKKQNIVKAVISLGISMVFTFFAILIIIAGGV